MNGNLMLRNIFFTKQPTVNVNGTQKDCHLVLRIKMAEGTFAATSRTCVLNQTKFVCRLLKILSFQTKKVFVVCLPMDAKA